MSYWKRLRVAENNEKVVQFWMDSESKEEIIITDTSSSKTQKGNYRAVTPSGESIGVYVEATELVEDLYVKKDLLVEGSVWRDEEKIKLIEQYPEEETEGHLMYPADSYDNPVCVQHIDTGNTNWIEADRLVREIRCTEANLHTEDPYQPL
jgi:hypothetical protein